MSAIINMMPGGCFASFMTAPRARHMSLCANPCTTDGETRASKPAAQIRRRMGRIGASLASVLRRASNASSKFGFVVENPSDTARMSRSNQPSYIITRIADNNRRSNPARLLALVARTSCRIAVAPRDIDLRRVGNACSALHLRACIG
jgi:hypothetical protein